MLDIGHLLGLYVGFRTFVVISDITWTVLSDSGIENWTLLSEFNAQTTPKYEI